jgi:signal transduction histidine kinase
MELETRSKNPSILESIPCEALYIGKIAFWELDLATKKVFRSKEHDELFGFPKLLPEWTYHHFVEALHPEDRERVHYEFQQLIKLRVDQAILDFRVKWPNGEVRWFDSRVRFLKDEEGNIIRACGTLIDQTELKITQKMLKEAVKSRDTFLSIASHELRTPLSALKLQAQLLKRNLAKNGVESLSPERIKKFLDLTELQVDRLNKLVEDMLDISRITLNKLVLNRQLCDLSQIVRNVLELMSRQTSAAQCELIIERMDSCPGKWDKFRIEQVVTQLFGNALKYGTGKPVVVTVMNGLGKAILKVKDHGFGIPVEYQNRIFGQFERIASDKVFSGLGLGLFISKQIVDSHQGSIYVESQLGNGATFIVELPLARDELNRSSH